MIEKITIKNYKSIRELTDFEMKPINILIGANNSGKSNFLDVFSFLRDTLLDEHLQNARGEKVGGIHGALQRRGGGESICFASQQSFQIGCYSSPFSYLLEIGQKQFDRYYRVCDERLSIANTEKKFFDLENGSVVLYNEDGINWSSKSPTNGATGLGRLLRHDRADQRASNFAKRLSEIKIYDRIHTEFGSPIRTPKISKGETILDEDGGNLVGVLHQLSQIQPRFLQRLNLTLKGLFPNFRRISFPSNAQGEILIRWEDENDRIAGASQLSDGTLKFLCLIAILENPNPPALIGIDEVDANLHPKMQAILADMLDGVSQRTQVIANTHNPDFVSMFTPDEIVILQQYRGETEMRRFSTKGALQLWIKDFGTRELWLMGELESRW